MTASNWTVTDIRDTGMTMRDEDSHECSCCDQKFEVDVDEIGVGDCDFVYYRPRSNANPEIRREFVTLWAFWAFIDGKPSYK